MDEIFQKAAGNYPLKTGESNWDYIAFQLTARATMPSPRNNKNATKKRTGLLLLLFIFLGTGGIFIARFGNKNEMTGSPKNDIENSSTNSVEKVGAPNKEATTINNEFTREPGEVMYSMTSNQRSVKLNAAIFKEGKLFEEGTDFENTYSENSIGISSKKNRAEYTPFNTGQKQAGIKQGKNIETKILKQDRMNSPRKPRGIYLGLVGGFTFNEVKNQGMNKAGYDVGLVGGYRINNKLSVETGFLLAKKYYYSNGKYFNMDMPSGMKVLSLEGCSILFEIPIKLKYDILDKNKGTFFSSAGIASYMLTNETNNYLALINGSQQNMKGEYKNMSRYFAAAIDLSLGYEYKVGKLTNIRIESYIQIPLKGIGVGSMPVTSAGLHIGITRAIH